MKQALLALFFGFSFTLHAEPAAAVERGTTSQAEAMVKKAVAFLKENGSEKAFPEFNNPKGQFVNRDLYISVTSMEGMHMAHGGNPKLVGKNTLDLTDADGKPFVRERIEIAKDKGKGWVNYKWINSVTKKIENKSTYFERVGNMIVSCGAYKL